MSLPAPKVRRVSGRGRVRYHAPTDPAAVYQVKDTSGNVIYVGASHEPDERVMAHRASKPWRDEIDTWTVEWYDNWSAAHNAEVQAIEAIRPKYNVTHTPLHRERSLQHRLTLTRAEMNELMRFLVTSEGLHRNRVQQIAEGRSGGGKGGQS